MPRSTNALPTTPGPAGLDLLIVARDHAGLCQALQELSAARKSFTVIVERRRAERRSVPANATGRRWPYVQIRRP